MWFFSIPCNVLTFDQIIKLMSLIVAIVSSLVALVIGLVSYWQNAKFNAVNLLKERLVRAFNDKLIDGFQDLDGCRWIVVRDYTTEDEWMVSFDKFPLISICDSINAFLGEISYLKYAIPRKYKRLNARANKIIDYVENNMLIYAVYEQAPRMGRMLPNMIISRKKARRIHKKFLHKVSAFYRQTFKLLKKGL